jgi:hypothetical protein
MLNIPTPNKSIMDYWYKFVAFASLIVLIVIDNMDIRLISLGCLLVGIGEWVNHPFVCRVVPFGTMTGYPRRPSFAGNAIIILGGIFIILGTLNLCN